MPRPMSPMERIPTDTAILMLIFIVDIHKVKRSEDVVGCGGGRTVRTGKRRGFPFGRSFITSTCLSPLNSPTIPDQFCNSATLPCPFWTFWTFSHQPQLKSGLSGLSTNRRRTWPPLLP
jgi:hypothetical protein